MSYYASYMSRLESVCSDKKAELSEIGRVNSMPMYKVTLNKSGDKRVVYSAGIHGEEIAGPWAIIGFLEQIYPSVYSNTRIDLFPVANPTGFERHRRHNYLGKDLNGFFCRKNLKGENKIIMESLGQEKISFFHALHEDTDFSTFYLYCFEHSPEGIYREVRDLAKKYFHVNKSRIILQKEAHDGMVPNVYDGSFEARMFSDGVPYSLCTETPGKNPLKERVDLNVKIMTKVLDFTSNSSS